MHIKFCAGRRRLRCAIGASGLAIAVATSAPAIAACNPNPTQAGVVTTCTDTESNGIAISTSSTVQISVGAQILSGFSDAAVLATANGFLSVNGTVAGGAKPGVLITNGSPFYVGCDPYAGAAPDFSGCPGTQTLTYAPTSFQISIGQDGSISGSNAIKLQRIAETASFVSTGIYNAGTISGTSGPALLAASGAYFDNIVNAATGTIGGIAGTVDRVTNAGIIDGATDSAISSPQANGHSFTYISSDAGQISSANSGATIAVASGYIYNAATIENKGSGSAVEASGTLTINNAASARITTAGTVGIRSGGALTLTNDGTIKGSVISLSTTGNGSSIDTRNGTIEGDLVLGATDDSVTAPFDAETGKVTNITGIVDGGAGIDTITLGLSADATIDALPLPTNFERFALNLSNNAAVTLGQNFPLPFGLTFGGNGTITVTGTVNTTGTAFSTGFNYSSGLSFINRGSISATLANAENAAIDLGIYARFDNSGSIVATGGKGVILGYNTAVNSGSIVADRTAVTANTSFSNSGTIHSNQGYGISIFASVGVPISNSGSISGALAGVSLLGATLVNSGTITSPNLGIDLSPYGAVDNRAGATISGGIGTTLNGYTFNAKVTNAGTINGNVDFGSTTFDIGNGNVFIALPNGIVNGNLRLGYHDLFVTSLANTGSGQYAGVTGTVTAGTNSRLLYSVDADATAVVGADAIFANVGYELSNDAVLTLSASAAQQRSIDLAGIGKVDLTVDLSQSGERSILNLAAQTVLTSNVTGTLAVTSHGTLIATHNLSEYYSYAAPAVVLSAGRSFTNAGTIIIHEKNTASSSNLLSAVSGSGTFINAGTIQLDGGLAVAGDIYSSTMDVTNSGTIEQLAGGAAGRGISGVRSVINSGSIITGGTAITLGAATTVINSGTIRSSNGAAIVSGGFYGQGSTVINQAGATIGGKAGSSAILLMPGATVDNAGTIDGNVIMTFSSSPDYTPLGNSTYVNRGGTLNGNLLFGAGDDIFVSVDGTTGVTGTINGGAGTDTFAVGYTSSQTVTATGNSVISFERQGIGAIGAGTTITIGAGSTIAGSVLLFGDGAIVNEADVGAATGSASKNVVVLGALAGATTAGSGLTFTNNSVIAEGVEGSVSAFTNTGTIGSASSGGQIIELSNAHGQTFSFANSGKILSSSEPACSYYCDDDGSVSISAYGDETLLLKAVTISNGATGEIRGGLDADFGSAEVSFTNDGIISAHAGTENAVNLYQNSFSGQTSASGATIANSGSIDGGLSAVIATGTLKFTNSGSIKRVGVSPALSLNLSGTQFFDPTTYTYHYLEQESLIFANSGSIAGSTTIQAFAKSLEATNTGSITVSADTQPSYYYYPGYYYYGGPAALDVALGSVTSQNLSVSNDGTVVSHAHAGNAIVIGATSNEAATSTISLINKGMIAVDGGAVATPATPLAGYFFPPVLATSTAVSINASSTAGARISITNVAGGTISASGDTVRASADQRYTAIDGGLKQVGTTAIVAVADTVTIRNDGAISGGPGGTAPDGFVIARNTAFQTRYIAGAIQTAGSVDTLINDATGTITGSIDLGDRDDRIENYGSITGAIFLRDGDDGFVQAASAKLVGTVDGGTGLDSLTIDASTGNGTIDAAQFVNFERFNQTGAGKVSYIGAFASDTIGLSGGTIAVDAGQMLSSGGAVTITGSSGAETVINAGTIAGALDLGAGNDSVVNRGTISGAIALGDGDDSYAEGPGSTVPGGLTGGAGIDTYRVILDGDRTGIGPRSGFEQLAVEGTGTLGLTLDQTYTNISLAGSGLDLAVAGFAPARIDGSAGDERLAIDVPIASIALAGGNDRLTTAGTTFAGSLDGGAGIDSLSFTTTDHVRIDGAVTGFETIALSGGTLDIAGTVGSADGSIGFGDGAQHLIVERGGTLAGIIDLGTGDDSIELLAGSILSGTVSGGAGLDLATIHVDGATTMSGNVLSQFERITMLGNVPVTIGTGTANVDRLDSEGGLSIAAAGTLNAGQVQFGAGDNQLVIAGSFSGSADGGAGADSLMLSGGSQTAAIALGNVTGFETLQENAGFTTVSGTAGFSSISLSGGRLVGLAGSAILAPQIGVGTGATFGSAGNVTGNIAVSGTLSPGASPGTMTVTGNVALATGSTTLFEITPTVTDKLLVSGTLSIASGATLSLVGDRPLTPGSTLDLIVADGGISGSFTTISKPASVFGFIAQRGNRIQLLGQFANDAAFPLSARRSIDYVNGVLTGGTASAGLLTALPSLLTSGGTSNAAAFSQLSPEVYASARQIGVENGLILIGAGRDRALTNGRDHPGAFSFAEGIGAWRDLKGSDAGAARADINGYGLLGGLGWDGGDWAVGGFTGYLNSRQTIAQRGAKTSADGVIAGVQARYSVSGLDLGALVAYDGGDARTRRALPANGSANGRFCLHNWTADLAIATNIALSSGWSLRPQAGISYVWTNRGAISESGGSPFALAIARSRDHAGFADAGLRIAGGGKGGDRFHPYVVLGGRYQISGRHSVALASLGGGGAGLIGEGVTRGRLLATANAGVAYDVAAGISLFASYTGEWGKDDGRQGVRAGMRIGF